MAAIPSCIDDGYPSTPPPMAALAASGSGERRRQRPPFNPQMTLQKE